MLEQLSKRCCPVCASTDQGQVFAEADYDPAKLDRYAFASRKIPEYMHYRLIHCPGCDLLYASPVPPPTSLATAYDEAAFDSAEEAGCAARTYGRLLQQFVARLPQRGAALDVGTGDGAFLKELLKAGFQQVSGIEPSSAPIAAADPPIRPLIRHGIFREADYPPASLDLLTCFQTVEHLSDPTGLCASAMRLLQPGGALLLVGHNYRSASVRLMGLRSPVFDIEHLQIFSPASMAEMLRRTGFDQVEVLQVRNRYPLHYWLKLFPLPRAIKPRLIATLKAIGLGYLPLALPAGNIAAIGWKKPPQIP